ncbi:MAG: preprotein translocase subunit YajC [Fusobacterium sp.]|jgi:preprotein translocase subunit YajC|uniref:preprotein translocase subunit YajC n=1 Tax=Fusobacterium sp. TaxID=68766 RepID=UPI0025CBCF3B|nr:preprotein translocase subunit YajC [uncultured Fusobacterium sp.]MCF2640649.1 preprotein translocase subunit YajC [Fusobacterium varium]
MNEILAKYGTWIMLVVWGLIIYLFMILPNKKKAKKQKEMLDSLKEGVNIVTIGGIKGTIVAVREEEVDVKVDKGIKVTFVKSAISRVL